ncbi:hypothetical protein [Pseudofrankia asymbiotica]|uniref:Uncharacterized protein n=1 Tax=Pseudofrankia asymbiotica TaxID=1834516 RepID=A0A1V2I735_9ACTN|nr:hypothetical protein [Pseudofrankia asymbiotica]ONH27506.1 hypothetical protein BL253_21670 [Pseudofrankia asymbiotica]
MTSGVAEDQAGPALVHTGRVHDGAGLQTGGVYIIRRAYPSGAARWVFTADQEATALDADTEFGYVAFNTGELVILRTDSGEEQHRVALHVDGHRVVPLSLARYGRDRLAVGTLDGRVLDLTVTAAPA